MPRSVAASGITPEASLDDFTQIVSLSNAARVVAMLRSRVAVFAGSEKI
jgi:hypothetical protein